MSAHERDIVEQPPGLPDASEAAPSHNGSNGCSAASAEQSPCGVTSATPTAQNGAPARIPTKEEFEQLNSRRHDLIDKQNHGGGLTPEEKAELDRVSERTLAYVNFHHPPPTLYLKEIEELARRHGIDLPPLQGS